MMIRFFTIGALSLGAFSAAFAGSSDVDTVDSMDLDGLKAKCVELAADRQIKPFTTTVTCRDVRRVWEASEPTSMMLPNSRSTGGAFRMKQFGVDYTDAPVAILPSSAVCNSFTQYVYTIDGIDSPDLSCDDLLAIDDVTTYCQGVIADELDRDPSIQSAEKTGETYNTCKGAGTIAN